MAVEYHSYLIRIWRDANLTHCGEWQGQVEQIQSGACWTFQSVETVLDLIHVEEHVTAVGEGLDNQGDTTYLSIKQKKLPKKEKPS